MPGTCLGWWVGGSCSAGPAWWLLWQNVPKWLCGRLAGSRPCSLRRSRWVGWLIRSALTASDMPYPNHIYKVTGQEQEVKDE